MSGGTRTGATAASGGGTNEGGGGGSGLGLLGRLLHSSGGNTVVTETGSSGVYKISPNGATKSKGTNVDLDLCGHILLLRDRDFKLAAGDGSDSSVLALAERTRIEIGGRGLGRVDLVVSSLLCLLAF
ncbi:hypothetical protein HDU83_001503 [Entophlyctis luteolus]|nr:hypothetical protein HDU83_001503 [Entophlyctis luteolus]KAJ3393038.1 hypothetical protein HDU84_002978 [Entophlyctis sp. JEL0112]